MNRRAIPPGTYSYDDLQIGDYWQTGRREVTGDLIDAFAELTHDRFEIHLDDHAATRYGFPSRVAHGLLVLSLIDGLKNNASVRLRAIASLGWIWSFRNPVLVGTSVQAVISVESMRPTSNAARGIVELNFDVRDIANTTLQSGTNALMLMRENA